MKVHLNDEILFEKCLFFLVGVILDTNRFWFVNVRDCCLVCDTVKQSYVSQNQGTKSTAKEQSIKTYTPYNPSIKKEPVYIAL